MIPKHIQEQIEKEAKDRADGWQNKMMSEIAKSEYWLGATAYAEYASKILAAEELMDKMVKNAEAIKEWCKESGLRDCAIDNPVHMAVYHSMCLAKMILDDINTYKSQSNDTTN